MTQQTAVEWLIEELGEYFPHEIGGIHLMVNAAKAMEKEQIINSYWDGGQDVPSTEKICEQYYNETYKK